jgi:hypothetical protein
MASLSKRFNWDPLKESKKLDQTPFSIERYNKLYVALVEVSVCL